MEKEELNFFRTYYDKVVPFTPFKKNASKVLNKLKELGQEELNDFYKDPYKTTREELQNGNIVCDKVICMLDKVKACKEEK